MPQYQGIWTLAQAAQLQSTQRWATDPLFENTTLLLQADNAANGAQNNTFLDSSSNNFTITRNGNTTQGAFTPFSSQPGAWSNYFNGATTSGPFVSTTYSTTNFDWFTSGQDFTLEYWIFPVDLSTFSYLDPTNTVPRTVGNNNQADSTSYWNFGPIADGRVRFHYFNGGVVQVTSTATVVANTWNHVAFTKTSSGITIFVNGVASTTTAISGTPQSSTGTALTIGRGNGGSVNGYISNIRILKNVTPPYSGAYTIPVLPLTAITGTRVLTAQANQFVDVSSIANTMSASGATVSVQPFSPFAPQYQYTPSVTGGSGYFDGSGDFLTIANNANLQVSGNVDMFVEAFIYLNTTGGKTVITKSGITGSSYPNWSLAINTSNKAAFVVGNSGSPGTLILNLAGATTLTIGQWYHLVGTKRYVGGGSVNEYRLFVNGVLDAFNTAANISDPRAANLSIGVEGSSTDYMNGYVQSLRFSNSNIPTSYQTTSTTVGATIFTPPTAPVTTTSQGASNVQLLLNFTNAGIYDGTLKNNLETVGNAQVSTSVVKYGTGSMYFDGTGDYLSIPYNAALVFDSGNFTVECWFYLTGNAGLNGNNERKAEFASCIVGIPTTAGWEFVLDGNSTTTGTGISFSNRINSSTAYTITATVTVNQNQWNHVAVVRNGTTTTIYLNGTSVGSGTLTNQSITSANSLWIGRQNVNNFNHDFPGYIDDLRVTKGIARYTANFTPPSVALPRQ